MRAIGFAALTFGAVIALSATLGVSYRSDASSWDDPSASVTDDPTATVDSAPAATATAAPDDVSMPTATAAPTPPPTAAAGSPSDDSTPAVARGLARFGILAVGNPVYTFPGSATVEASFTLEAGNDSASIHYAQADSNGTDIGSGAETCDLDVETTSDDCAIALGGGLWHLTAFQNSGSVSTPEDAYVYIPAPPTIAVNAGDGTDFVGTGDYGDSIHVFDTSGNDVCDTTVDDGGDWACDPASEGSFDFDRVFTATQVDAGDPNVDGVNDTVPITRGGISQAATYTPPPPPPSTAPALQYQFFPGGVTVTSTPAEGYDSVFVTWYTWAAPPESGDEGGSDGFLRQSVCPFDPDGSGEESSAPPTGPISCTFGDSTPLAPGIYNPYAHQTNVGGDGEGASDYADDYFVVPAAPTITAATSAGNRVVTVSGTGVVTDGIRVIVDGATVACTATTVSANGTWSCKTAALKNGTHSLRAYQVDLGAGQSSEITGYDQHIVYLTGGESGLSATRSIKVAAATVAPSATPTDFANWFFTVTGIDLNNVHPGDRFTVTGSGLPPGATVSGELHSKAVSIGSAVVQPDGTFSLPVTVPADFPAGAHTIVMTLTPTGSTAVVSQQPLKVVPASDTSGAGDAPTPSNSPSPLGSSEGPGIDHHGPNSNILTHGLNSIADVLAHPAKIPAAIEIGLVLLIFAVLPGHLLNATLAEQYERFTKRRAQRRKAHGRWARVVAFLHRAPFAAGLLLTTVTALLFGFADPRFGFSLASLRLFLGLAIALAVVSYLTNAIVGRIMRGRWKVDVEVNLRPLGLILTVVGVVVSRLLDFSPGFLIGLVLGLVISERHLAKQAWRAVLLRSSILLGLAMLAWFAFSLFDAREEGGTFASELAVETLVAITTEAVVGLLVELLPLKLLEGEKLYEKSKALWGALYLVAIFIFVVAVVPWEGNWAELGTSLWTWIGIVVGFGIVATGIYLYFRIRTHDEHERHENADESDDELVPISSEDE